MISMERTIRTHGRMMKQFDLLGAVSSAGEQSQATIQGTPWETLATPGAVLRKKVVLRVILRQRWSASFTDR
jgi:hypothetical protein